MLKSNDRANQATFSLQQKKTPNGVFFRCERTTKRCVNVGKND